MKAKVYCYYWLMDIENINEYPDDTKKELAQKLRFVHSGDLKNIMSFVDDLESNKKLEKRDGITRNLILCVDSIWTLGNTIPDIIDVWNVIVSKGIRIQVLEEELDSNDKNTQFMMEKLSKIVWSKRCKENDI